MPSPVDRAVRDLTREMANFTRTDHDMVRAGVMVTDRELAFILSKAGWTYPRSSRKR